MRLGDAEQVALFYSHAQANVRGNFMQPGATHINISILSLMNAQNSWDLMLTTI